MIIKTANKSLSKNRIETVIVLWVGTLKCALLRWYIILWGAKTWIGPSYPPFRPWTPRITAQRASANSWFTTRHDSSFSALEKQRAWRDHFGGKLRTTQGFVFIVALHQQPHIITADFESRQSAQQEFSSSRDAYSHRIKSRLPVLKISRKTADWLRFGCRWRVVIYSIEISV